MKKLILLLTAVAIGHATVFPQGCLPDGIYFTSQAQIDNFQANYPACTQIEGNVDIWGDDITNLNGLNALTSIGGGLNIHHAHLVNLAGLENLTFLGGGLSIGIQYNHPAGFPDLISLTGLEGLTSIGGSLIIADCGSLTSLSGIENVTFIQGDIDMRRLWSLASLTGLENVTSIQGSLLINQCNLITSLTGLENLASIQGEFSLYGNYSLCSISALSNLTSISGGISIMINPLLTSLSGLDNIDAGTISYINICYNDSLTTCNAESVCNYIANPSGTILISGNSTGCNNPPEVADACGIAFSCLPYGNYMFSSQADIDNFQALYPGCSQLEGNVDIWGDDITNLDGLSIVTSIGGSLSINGPPLLTNLTGLHNLTSIGGDLNISGQSLTSLAGLGNVTSIGGSLNINAQSLTNMMGLDNLASIGGNLSIWNCSALTILTGLNHVSTIGGTLMIGNSNPFWGGGNDSLTSLTGLEGLTNIGGGISIWQNTSLNSLTGLDNIKSIGGSIGIYYNSSLTSLTGLDNLNTIVGDLWIYGNDALSTLEGLENITSIAGNVNLNEQCSLANLSGLNNLTSIGGGLDIEGCALTSLGGVERLNTIGGTLTLIVDNNLSGLAGFDSLTSVGSLNIVANQSLNSLSGLNKVTSIAGNIIINSNQSLTNLYGLDNIAAGSISGLNISANSSLSNCQAQSICNYLAAPNGVVDIFGNAAGCNSPPEVAGNCGITIPCLPYGNYYFYKQSEIDNFTTNYPGCMTLKGNVCIEGNDISNLLGLYRVTSISGNLIIGSSYDWGGGNSSLTSLAGLNSLTSIGGYLSIKRNNILTNLTGLENVTSIGGYLDISNNDALTSLTGLNYIDAGSIHDLYIYNNTSLSNCEVQSICNYLSAPGGIISIGSNAPGCNSREEVEAACHVGMKDLDKNQQLTIYPNPSSGLFTFEFYLQQPSMVNLVVHNNLGQVVAEIGDEMPGAGLHQLYWKAEDQPSGVYYYRLQAGHQNLTGKMILMR